MAELQAIVEWPGLETIESCSVTQSHGPTPSAFSITCYPQKKSPPINGDLTLRYGGFSRTFKDCLIDAASYQFNAGGEIIGLTIFDWRWRWRCGTVSGRYNQRKISGKLNDSFYPTKKPQELAKLCLEEMSQQGYDVGDMPNDEYPEVNWDYENPASALEQLCTTLGCRIVPLRDNKVKICKAGEGKNLNADLPYEGLSESIDLADQYDAIEVIGAPIAASVTYTLQAVGQSAEPAREQRQYWQPIDDLPYKPATGWTSESPLAKDGATEEEQGYAKRSVLRWYEPTSVSVAKGSKLLDEAGVKSPLTDYRNALPLIQEILASTFDGVTEFEEAAKTYEPQVRGIHQYLSMKAIPPDMNEDTKVELPFNIEQTPEHLLVKFQEPIYKRDNTPSAPSLRLLGVANILHPKTKIPIRYTFKRKLRTPKGKESVLELRQNDIQLYHGADAGFNKKILAECDKRANFYIDAKLKEMQNRNPQTQNVVGWFDQTLDGAIQAAEWTMDSGGASMTIHRNDDPGTSTTVSYAERQGNIRQARTERFAGALVASAERARRAIK